MLPVRKLLCLFAALFLALPVFAADSARVMVLRAEQLRKEFKYPEALAQVAQILKIYPSCVDALSLRSDIYKEQGHLQQALADMNLAHSLEPNNLDIYKRRCRMLDMMGRLDAALVDYEDILKKCPADPQMWAYRGQAYKRLKRYEEAARDFARAVACGPNHRDTADWMYESGNCNLLIGKLPEALQVFDLMVKRFPDLSTGFWGRAKVLEKMNRPAEAEKARAQAKKLDLDLDPAGRF